MMGLAGTITPTGSGRVLLIISGMALNSGIAGITGAQICYGTGAAPANAAAVTGTAVGKIKHLVASTAAGKQGFTCVGIVTGLVVGTAYWIDLAVEASANNASVYDIDIVAVEL